MKLEFSSKDFRKLLKYQISLKSVQWESSCFIRTDGRTDMRNIIVAFCNFGNAPKNHLMLYREIIAVCSEIHTEHINTLCGQNVELLNVKLVVH